MLAHSLMTHASAGLLCSLSGMYYLYASTCLGTLLRISCLSVIQLQHNPASLLDLTSWQPYVPVALSPRRMVALAVATYTLPEVSMQSLQRDTACISGEPSDMQSMYYEREPRVSACTMMEHVARIDIFLPLTRDSVSFQQ